MKALSACRAEAVAEAGSRRTTPDTGRVSALWQRVGILSEVEGLRQIPGVLSVVEGSMYRIIPPITDESHNLFQLTIALRACILCAIMFLPDRYYIYCSNY